VRAKKDLDPPPAPGNAGGVAVIAALTVAVIGWLYTQRPEAATRGVPKHAELSALAGFRADAWFLPDDDLLGFVEIPAGSFRMGSDPGGDPRAFENERWSQSPTDPGTGTVDLPTFYIGRYEVTVAQFRAFTEGAAFHADGKALEGAPNAPVAFVSWPDALAYCRWLETNLSESPDAPSLLRSLVRDGWRVTLPSEAQWEKAARGTDGRIFPWGNEPRGDRANYGGARAMPVGSFPCPECPFPLSDMSGNLWELTQSPYRPYPYDPSIDNVDLDADALWVMRGGSYGDREQNIRAAVRGGVDPGARRPFIGFRVVLNAPGP
jgi:formylglycine-generating enzyme required for sulfatase activity